MICFIFKCIRLLYDNQRSNRSGFQISMLFVYSGRFYYICKWYYSEIQPECNCSLPFREPFMGECTHWTTTNMQKNIPCDSMQWLTKQPNFSYFQTHSSQKNTTKQATVARKRKMKKIVQPAIPRHAVLVETRWWYRRIWWWKRLGLTFCHVPRSWEFFHYYSRRRTMKTYNLQNKAKC